ncbi:SMC interacting uncharacterized protein involved in chromosome segregation [Bradyrhizobium sp. USDA 4524]|uniref:type III secretion system stalk subunit SctO n=1 Tax=unclassified Bradyrhizobium TaxID=2631580 RepID=UPI0020A095BB|nr:MULTISPECIES: YscO family type III secretion system apparatus protein [unclassified Bradyrhizobium]MCP1846090.1 SMC interacting uncharacterized protein involved in chromosome segregation [Bradyrhizobium sp. USDA 4538]MCP1907276.1 SMC interacting uncharacterized protein involved in chromosome segregation [Bradyrhizobium sp. USDA 4537]MCP1985751.1 SMC interacting uncharacterized protein involved in chromosome segregation [Bradyrhizobium sp. USDA 4539]
MVDFGQIVRIRSRRLDHARRNLARSRRLFAEAGRRFMEAQDAADTFLKKTRTLEIDLLTEILNKPVTTNDLRAIEERLRKTQDDAQNLANVVAAARHALTESGDALEMASTEKKATESRLNKSREMHDLLRQIVCAEEIAAEDAELDEFCELIASEGRGP